MGKLNVIFIGKAEDVSTLSILKAIAGETLLVDPETGKTYYGRINQNNPLAKAIQSVIDASEDGRGDEPQHHSTKTIPHTLVPELLSGGQIFTIEFTKKDGSIRKMNGRLGVSKHVTGNGTRRKSPDHITVFETNTDRIGADCYRSVKLDSIKRIRAHGQTYIVV